MSKRRPLTAEDVKKALASNPSLAAGNPGLLAELGSPEGTAVRQNRPNLPVCGKSCVPIAEKAKRVKKMTRTEMEYEAMLKKEFPDRDILFERYTLKLANDCRYTPDFATVELIDCGIYYIEFHEVKGAFLFGGATKSATAASLTKPKTAAQLYPWHRFYIARKDERGNWSRELVSRIDP